MNLIEQYSKPKKFIILTIVVLLFCLIIVSIVEVCSYFILKKTITDDYKTTTYEEFIQTKPQPFNNADDFEAVKNKVLGLTKCPESRIIFEENTGFPKYEIQNIKCNGVEDIENGIRVTIGQNKTAKHNLFAFGGSTMWGTYSADRNTIPSLLQSKINLNRKSFNVFNYGFSTVVAHQELKKLESLTLNKGDVVVFYDGGNDIWNDVVYGVPTGSIIGYNDKNRFSRFVNKVKYFLSTSSYFYLLLSEIRNKKNFNKSADCFQLNKTELEKRLHNGVEVYLNAIKKAREYAKSKGALFFHFFQPLLVASKPYSDYGNYLLSIQKKEFLCGLPFAEKGFIYYQSQYLRLNKEGINSNDISQVLNSQNNEEYFLDWIHVSSMGNKKIANVIFEKIKDSL